MNPHGRQKNPMRDEMGSQYPPFNKRQRISYDDGAHDEATRHSSAKHYTISRDATSLGSSKKDKLRVLQLSGDGEQSGDQYGDQNHIEEGEGTTISASMLGSTSTIHQGDIYDHLRHSRRNDVSDYDEEGYRLPPPHGYSDVDSPYRFQNDKPNSVTSQPSSFDSLQKRIQILQSENESLRQQQKREDVNFKVLYCISNQTYLEKPYWDISSKGAKLKANSPVLYPDAYIQYNFLAFVIYRHYSLDQETETKTTKTLQQNKIPDPTPAKEVIQIVSVEMKEALKAFIKNNEDSKQKFPRIFEGEEMQAPYHWWYYYRNQPNVFDKLSHFQAELIRDLTNWINHNYSTIYSQIDSQFDRGMVSKSSLSFLIQPGDVLVHRDEDSVKTYLAKSWLKREMASAGIKGHSYDYASESDNINGIPVSTAETFKQKWGVNAWSYGYNGHFYRVTEKLRMTFDTDITSTEISITSLRIYPLRFAARELCESLEQRGATFWSCRYKRYVSYASKTKDREYAPGQRYMVDYLTYQELHSGPKDKSNLTDEFKVESTFIKQESPSKPDIYLLPGKVLGFNLRRKKWEDLNVDLIEEVSWNTNAFSNLVADSETKDLVEALVTNKVAAEKGTDLMENKGNGLIMLLHGGPGTGKTFTAESVAELAQKPLYPIWGCVVLLDEAEVFLEQRSLNDLARNALVSVFLRALEYYDGILILTSNRVGTFDEAFKSRIQLALHYEPLTQPRRAKIWRNFFRRLESLGEDNIDYGDVENYIGELSEREMNGRQIRNVITTARQWAQFQSRKMTASHLEYAIKVAGKFDTYVKDLKEGFSDEQIARGDGVR